MSQSPRLTTFAVQRVRRRLALASAVDWRQPAMLRPNAAEACIPHLHCGAAATAHSIREYRSGENVIEAAEISFLDPESVPHQWASTPSSSSAAAIQATASPAPPTVVQDVKDIDAFSRVRVVSFLRRYSKDEISSRGGGIFRTVEIDDNTYHCTIRLPISLPPCYRPEGYDAGRAEDGLWAHGVACSAKDAELLASMHAEYLVDLSGYHIYSLPSMQRKHAEAALRAGRYAPSPEHTEGTSWQPLGSVPLPLRRILTDDETEGGEWYLVATGKRSSPYLSPSHTLLSPSLLEEGARQRLEGVLAAAGTSLVAQLTTEKISIMTPSTAASGGVAFVIAKLALPPAVVGSEESVVAIGKARDRTNAVLLACMHAELILDVLQIPLFADDGLQKMHAMTAWGYDRPASLPGSPRKHLGCVRLPDPLKEMFITAASGQRVSPRNAEEEYFHRHELVSEQCGSFVDTEVEELTAVDDLLAFLKECRGPRATSPFVRVQLAQRVRSSVLLPLPEHYGVRGGVGIASTEKEADTLAAMHSLDILMALGIGVKGPVSSAEDTAWKSARHAALCDAPEYRIGDPATIASPPGRRLLAGKFAARTRVNADSTVVPSTTVAFPPITTAEAASPPRKKTVKRAKAATHGSDEVSQGYSEGISAPSSAPSVDYLVMRRTVSKDHWDLVADSPDGYLLVEPAAPATSLLTEYAIISPRVIDPLSKQRIRMYLEGTGRRFEDVVVKQKIAATETGETDRFRCILKMPLPAKYGDRLAMAEADTAADAELLAAMHAELLLDTVGVCLYPDTVKQHRHAEACARYGRWAPSQKDEEKSCETPSPPPLRQRPVALSPVQHSRGKRRRTTVQAKVLEQADVSTPTPEPTASLVEQCTAMDGGTAVSETDAVEETIVEEMEVISDVQLDAVSKPRVQYYMRHEKINVAEATFTSIMGRGVISYVATWTLQLPARLGGGTRAMKGVATTKRDADILSWMHAERTLDALRVPLFPNLPKLQAYHAQRVASLGRTAPTLESVATTSLDSELRVKPLQLSLSSAVGDLTAPPIPSPVNLSAEAWDAYVDQCAAYIQGKVMLLNNQYFDVERAPRTGDPIIDSALEESEASTPSSGNKLLLQLYCNAANYRYPTIWKSQTVGPLTHRVSFTKVRVPGYAYVTACGVSTNKEASQRRAVSHIMGILRRIDPNYEEHLSTALQAYEIARGKGDSVQGNEEEEPFDLESFSTLPQISAEVEKHQIRISLRTERRRSQFVSRGPAWDSRTGEFTEDGRRRLIRLYALCCNAAEPSIKTLVRLGQQRCQSALDCTGKPSSLSGAFEKESLSGAKFSTEVTIVDDDGNAWSGRGSGGGPHANEGIAYENLFKSLEKSLPIFNSLAEVMKDQPYMTPEQIPCVDLSPAIKQRMEKCIDAQNSLPRRGKATDVSVWDLMDSGNMKVWVDNAAGDSDTPAQELAAQRLETQQQKSCLLLQRMQERLRSELYIENFAKKRESLSIASHRTDILGALQSNQVVVICGTTGCGKTTQVPQYIFDECTVQGRGGECSILVTQPRRLSAVSIAQRVASERLERVGDTCGYMIRFDSHPGDHITFCTTGVLLRMLHSSPTLERYNYIIVDEIHERDINSDFLLILLRELIQKRPDLHLILMSATLHAEQFGDYFRRAPILRVEGHMFPVKELYLEDLVQYAEEQKVTTPLMKEVLNTTSKEADVWNKTNVFEGSMKDSTHGVLEATSEIDYPTIQFAIDQALRMVDLSGSSILVFLPGWDEIIRAKEILERNPLYHILMLHSSVGAEEQMQCFLPAKAGKIKVILSTNIAESGVTIDDIGAVIDLGRAKQKSFVMKQGRTQIGRSEQGQLSQLLTVYASRANCVQRRGRVGRTRPGICIRLYSREHFEKLHDFQTPELLRTPLDSLCLHILALRLGSPNVFLRNAIEPPEEAAVLAAMGRLHDLGATTAAGELTPLGYRLSQLPIEPKIGKVILLGAVLRCLDSALTVAAVSQGDVFLSARENREAVRLHREDLSKDTLSDYIASVNGYNFWAKAHLHRPPAEVVRDLEARLLSVPQLLQVSRQKQQFFNILVDSGFLPRSPRCFADALTPLKSGSSGSNADSLATSTNAFRDGEVFVDHSTYSENSRDVGAVKSVIAACFFPHLAVHHGRRTLRTKLENIVYASGDCVISKAQPKRIAEPFFVYSEVAKSQESRRLTMRGINAVPIWSILLMSAPSMPIDYLHSLNLGVVDEWLYFRASFAVVELLRSFRAALDQRLAHKFVVPGDEDNNRELEEMCTILRELANQRYRPNLLVPQSHKWGGNGVILETGCDDKATEAPKESAVSGSEDGLNCAYECAKAPTVS